MPLKILFKTMLSNQYFKSHIDHMIRTEFDYKANL